MDKKLIGILIGIIIGVILLLSIYSFAMAPTAIESNKSVVYYLKALNANIVGIVEVTTSPTTTPTGTIIISKEQSLTAECIEKILVKYDSPVKNTGLGKKILEEAKSHEIDAGYALATFRVESSFGKNGYAVENKSIGNRKDTSGNFIKYNSWEEGITDWFDYIERKYISQGITTVEKIAPIYAPSTENDTAKYIKDIKGFIEQHKGLC